MVGFFAFLVIRVFHPLFTGVCFVIRRFRIPWSYNSWINKFIGPLCRYEQFSITKCHGYRVARKYIADIHLKYIGTILLQQRGRLALLLSLFVLLSCFFFCF